MIRLFLQLLNHHPNSGIEKLNIESIQTLMGE